MPNNNPTGKGGFGERKGDIWRKGRPRSFDALRELAQAISNEQAIDAVTKKPMKVSGHNVSVTEAILRTWAHSPNPLLQKAFMEIAFGTAPKQVEVGNLNDEPFKTKNTIIVRVKDD